MTLLWKIHLKKWQSKDSEKMMIEDQEFLKHDKAVVPKMTSPRITKKCMTNGI